MPEARTSKLTTLDDSKDGGGRPGDGGGEGSPSDPPVRSATGTAMPTATISTSTTIAMVVREAEGLTSGVVSMNQRVAARAGL